MSKDEFTPLLESYVETYGFDIDQLSYNFVSKEKLFKLNEQFLNHSTHTDIITFDYTKNKSLKAEFFISLWAVYLSANDFSQSPVNEVVRVMIHGVLHCLGQNDATEENKKDMRILEDQFIKMFHVKHTNHV